MSADASGFPQMDATWMPHGSMERVSRPSGKPLSNERENYGQWFGNTRSHEHAGECEQQKEAVDPARHDPVLRVLATIETTPNGGHRQS